ncbi:ATP-binding protein, partial [Candidatus Bathyarchaeota archaeon]|nr:ATP-binding protein [Candidatus Bathyarchaeota archaeon]
MTQASEDKDRTKRMVEAWRTKDLIGYSLEDLDLRVKKDRAVKLSVLATGLSALLGQPINLFLKGESGIGKTYNVTETLKYFVQGDIWFLGGMSQKSLIHAHGKLLNKDGEEIDLENRPVKPSKKDFETEDDYKEAITQYQDGVRAFREEFRESYTLIDLSHKILVFLEAPDFGTYQMLRPILSHDKEEIQYQFVDKTAKGQLRTMKVVLKGWPATIFLTTDNRYMEELATRSFTATPESSEDKIKEANILTNEKASLPWKHEKETEAFTIIKRLIENLQKNTLESKIDVVIPFL